MTVPSPQLHIQLSLPPSALSSIVCSVYLPKPTPSCSPPGARTRSWLRRYPSAISPSLRDRIAPVQFRILLSICCRVRPPVHDSQSMIRPGPGKPFPLQLTQVHGYAGYYQLANGCDTQLSEAGTTISGWLRELVRLVSFLTAKTVEGWLPLEKLL